MGDTVQIVEMSPRDGLQNEPTKVPTAGKIALIDMLSETGLRRIEATSFVSPKWVPQLADAAEVMQGIRRKPDVTYSVLTPNQKGLERAIAVGADEVAVFASASEGFSQRNINCSIAESIERFRPMMAAAQDAGLKVRGYVSCVTDCPYDGPTAPSAVARVVADLIDIGCFEISLGDTIGQATPTTTQAMLEAVLDVAGAKMLAGHFHNTNGRALDNIDVALEAGIRCFDASAGGLGGCPYAPGAQGNVATEAVVARLHQQGMKTGVDLGALQAAATFAQSLRTNDG
jgi:hydroxymethylglutaryl-CoA lyase